MFSFLQDLPCDSADDKAYLLLETETNGSLCGIGSLNIGNEYLLTGITFPKVMTSTKWIESVRSILLQLEELKF